MAKKQKPPSPLPLGRKLATFPVPPALEEARLVFAFWLDHMLLPGSTPKSRNELRRELRKKPLRSLAVRVAEQLFARWCVFVERTCAEIIAQAVPSPDPPERATREHYGPPLGMTQELLRRELVLGIIRLRRQGISETHHALGAAARSYPDSPPRNLPSRPGAPGNLLASSLYEYAVLATSMPGGPANLRVAAEQIMPLLSCSLETAYVALREQNRKQPPPKRWRGSKLAALLGPLFLGLSEDGAPTRMDAPAHVPAASVKKLAEVPIYSSWKRGETK